MESSGWSAGPTVDEIHILLFLLEVARGNIRVLPTISPRRSILTTPAAGASGASQPVAIIDPCAIRLFWVDAVGDGAVLSRGVVGVLVPQALAIEESVEVLLVDGRPKLGSVGDSDGVLVGSTCGSGSWTTRRSRGSCVAGGRASREGPC